MPRNALKHELKYKVDLYTNGLRLPARNLPENTRQGATAIAETFGADMALMRYAETGEPKELLLRLKGSPGGAIWGTADANQLNDLLQRRPRGGRKGGGR